MQSQRIARAHEGVPSKTDFTSCSLSRSRIRPTCVGTSDPSSATMEIHHSLVELPRPRDSPRARRSASMISGRNQRFRAKLRGHVPRGVHQPVASRSQGSRRVRARGAYRARRASYLLPRSGHPRALSHGVSRGRQLVEHRVPGGGVAKRLSGSRSTRRRRPNGCAIQPHLLGASQRARTVRRSIVRRSTNRRDRADGRADGFVALVIDYNI